MPKTKKARTACWQTVPYVRGFRPPSAKQRLEAIIGSGRAGGSSKTSETELAYAPTGEFFPPLPKPTSIDDWLAQYRETGQTYDSFMRECPWLSQRKRKSATMAFNPRGADLPGKYPEGKIYLLPLGGFDGKTTPKFSDLAEYTRLFYCLPVEILPPLELRFDQGSVYCAESADFIQKKAKDTTSRKSSRPYKLDARFHPVTGSVQLQVSSILWKLRQVIPSDAICLMALTMADLFDEAPDLFVAGMAAGNHRVGVFSFCRYDPTVTFSSEFWYQVHQSSPMREEERRRIVLQRSCKLLVHEVAHLLGVDHCIWFSCCMNGSGHLEEDFGQSMHLCPVDLRKLQTLCGFDVVERYRHLLGFFERQGLKEEGVWVRRRVEFITAK